LIALKEAVSSEELRSWDRIYNGSKPNIGIMVECWNRVTVPKTTTCAQAPEIPSVNPTRVRIRSCPASCTEHSKRKLELGNVRGYLRIIALLARAVEICKYNSAQNSDNRNDNEKLC
jgi:hypothetical protein